MDKEKEDKPPNDPQWLKEDKPPNEPQWLKEDKPPNEPQSSKDKHLLSQGQSQFQTPILDLLGEQSDKRNYLLDFEEGARDTLYEKFVEVRRDCSSREKDMQAVDMNRQIKHLRLVEGCARALRVCVADEKKARVEIEGTQRVFWNEICSLEISAQNRIVLLRRSATKKQANKVKQNKDSRDLSKEDPHVLEEQRRADIAELQRSMDYISSLWFGEESGPNFLKSACLSRPTTVAANQKSSKKQSRQPKLPRRIENDIEWGSGVPLPSTAPTSSQLISSTEAISINPTETSSSLGPSQEARQGTHPKLLYPANAPPFKLRSFAEQRRAVIAIQRRWRGYKVRSELWDSRHRSIECPIGSASALDAPQEIAVKESECDALERLHSNSPSEKQSASATLIAAVVRGFLVRRALRMERESISLHHLIEPSEEELKMQELKRLRALVKKNAYNKCWKVSEKKMLNITTEANEIALIRARLERRKHEQYLEGVQLKRLKQERANERERRQQEFDKQTRARIREAIVKEGENRKLQASRLMKIQANEQRLRASWHEQDLKQRDDDKKVELEALRQRFKKDEDREMHAITEHIRLRQHWMGETLELSRKMTILDLPNAGAKLGSTTNKKLITQQPVSVLSTYQSRIRLMPIDMDPRSLYIIKKNKTQESSSQDAPFDTNSLSKSPQVSPQKKAPQKKVSQKKALTTMGTVKSQSEEINQDRSFLEPSKAPAPPSLPGEYLKELLTAGGASTEAAPGLNLLLDMY